eukprot:6192731-Pleurochrysis_carterae.AAC.2
MHRAYHKRYNEEMHRRESEKGGRFMQARRAGNDRLRPLGLQRNPYTDRTEPYTGAFDHNPLPTQQASPTPSDEALVRELEQVEHDLRKREHAELLALRAQVAHLSAQVLARESSLATPPTAPAPTAMFDVAPPSAPPSPPSAPPGVTGTRNYPCADSRS